MATIDDKVVAMSFESSKFESGVHGAISALDKLKAALKLPGSSKSLEDVSNAANKIDLSHIGKSVDAIQQKLSYFSVAALAIFAQIASKAVAAGASMVKAFTLDPMKAGFAEYSTNLNSVQTILANTQASGAGLREVNAALDELNEYSDKTIYNFSQMARNIGTFTAAGVDLKTATASIKGIANLAALSGSNSEQASTAMYQLSQAISAGSVKLMDWNSVVNAGMGGTVFQRALAQTAEHMGKLKEGTVQLVGPMKNVKIAGESFRNSLSAPGKDGWLTSDVLTSTLKQLTGDMTNAELRADGWSASQIKAIQLQAKAATLAATNVKTLAQVIDVAKETAGSGWAQTWRIIFGDFSEAKKTFTALSNAINGIIIDSAQARNNMLGDWKALGGRTVLIDAISTAFHNLGLILKPIKEAFRDIFPAQTGKGLFDLTLKFKDFAEALKPSAETVKNLHRTFAGLFAVMDIGWQIVKGIGTVFVEMFKAVSGGGGTGGFLALTASIGDFFVAIDKALKKGDALHNFFVGLGKVLGAPLALLSKFAGVFGDLFSGISFGGVSKGLDGMGKAMSPLEKIIEGIADAWERLTKSFDNAVDMESVIKNIGIAISGIGVALGNMFSNMNFEAILAFIRTGLFAGLVLMFKQFLGKGSILEQISGGFSGGILENISGAFAGLNGSMKAMQQNLKAKTLKEIAIAIALLAAAVLLLSLVDPKKLSGALGAMTILFVELIAAMAILDKMATGAGFVKLPFIVASLIGLAVAIDLLTLAVVGMSLLSWNELIKGLTGVGVLLGGISAASIVLSANSGGLIRASVGMIAIGVALNILALAVRQFGSMSLEELGKGLASVAIGLGVMVLALNKMPEGAMALKASVGIIAIAVALKIMASAIADLASLSLQELAKGLIGIGVALKAIVLTMTKLPANIAKNAAGLLLVAAALWIISDAVGRMGALSLSEIAKGLIGLGGALLILVVGLNHMAGTLAGAGALAIAAAGLSLLIPSIVLLGQQSWSTIIKGMVALAGALAILGLAGLALAPTIPALLGLGVALTLIGGGIALVGAGVFLLASGLSLLAVSGTASVGILIAAINEFLEAIPKLAVNFALGMLSVVDALSATAPKFVDAILKIVESLVEFIVRAAPKMAEAFVALLDAGLNVLKERQTQIIAAGLSLLIALLKGIRDNIGQLVTTVADIITKFLSGISTNLTKIIAAGASILVSLLKGIGDSIADVVLAAGSIITKFIGAITTNLGKILTAGIGILTKLVTGIGQNAKDLITAGGKAVVKFIEGITDAGVDIIQAGRKAAGKFMNALATEIPKLAQDAFDAVIKLINGISKVIGSEENLSKLRSAGMSLGWAIINGMTLGLAGKARDVYNKATEIANTVAEKLHLPFSINSPSKLTQGLGKSIVEGMVLGLDDNAQTAYASATALSNGVIGAFNTTFQTASPSKVMMQIGQYVGQGFAQGLRGSGEDINKAFTELNNKLTEAMVTARTTIATEQEKLDELRKAKKPDAEAIAATQRIINENEALLRQSTAGRLALQTILKDEQKELVKLTNQYDTISEKIKTAQEELKKEIKERDDLQASLISQYSTGPSLNVDTDMTSIIAARTTLTEEQNKLNEMNAQNSSDAAALQAQQLKVNQANQAYNLAVAGRVLTENGTAVDQLASYMVALKNQTAAVGAYDSTLKQLRKLGLDDVTYRRLLAEGTADESFANQLLAGGRTAVQALNVLDANLKKVSESLAKEAAKNLEQGGVDSAKGLLKGLTSQNAKIRQAMDNIIDDIIHIIKSKMKIKSPSKVFEEMGAYAMIGLANGFSDNAKLVNKRVERSLKDTLATVWRTISHMREVNPELVITPILDFSTIRNQAKEFRGLNSSFTTGVSLRQAEMIGSTVNSTQGEDSTSLKENAMVKFEQNNYSPKALTEIEIYRQTKNQLSQIKAVLGT